jgi:hypothetical protein
MLLEFALMDAYTKCGDARLAFEVLDVLPDMVSLGSVMRAMSAHDQCR